ncbi:polysaccharide biosynthesis/export family protein [Robertkochia aurantiaca]|uniref:polysaccharide biosynthesis/export family protein n=1 Tax=Robertkochia aurantiaca TaxID=2873700 RepID=UPI001CCED3DC|nr:polysaccharide biosynthesis/export family protein [Robertkochia sp. 3YJGBD-33]
MKVCLKNLNSFLCLSWITVVFFSSCASREDVAYFQNAREFETVVETRSFEPRFKVDDVVSIYISTFDMEAAKPFNLTKGEGVNYQEVEYVINEEGFIDFPVIGKLKLLGLTSEEAKALLIEELDGYLKDPVINIRIKNFRVTVLGHVQKPGTYSITSERITLLEALGLAGDLEIKARRDNVLVIRDFDGVKTYTRVDLTTKEFVNSPVYYLTQNDVVYVEPNNSAIRTSTLDTRATIIVSLLSLVVTSTVLIITRT